MRRLYKLFRRLMLERLAAAHKRGKLTFFGKHAALTDPKAFAKFLKPLKRKRWFVYAKHPFAGPKAVLAYLSRYTNRVAISNARLIAADTNSVTFRVKDYRLQGASRYTTMSPVEFIRRFPLHVSPNGFHRIRHYALLAGTRAEAITTARELLAAPAPDPAIEDRATDADTTLCLPCPSCGGGMHIIEPFEVGCQPHHRPTALIRIDTS